MRLLWQQTQQVHSLFYEETIFIYYIAGKKIYIWEHVVWCMDGSNNMFSLVSHSSPLILTYCFYFIQLLHIWEFTLNVFFQHFTWSFLHCLKFSMFSLFFRSPGVINQLQLGSRPKTAKYHDSDYLKWHLS